MNRRREISRQVIVYLRGSFSAQLLAGIAGILMRRFLGPMQTGIWTLLQVFVKYANYSSFGTFAAAAREIPYHNGRGHTHRVKQIQNTLFSFGLTSSTVLAVAAVIGACLLRSRMRQELFWGLLITAGVLVLQRLNNVLVTIVRAHKEFRVASDQLILSALVNAVLVALLSYRFRIYGYMVALALSFAFNTIYLWIRSKIRLEFQLDKNELKALAGYGLPLVAIGLLNTAVMSIDRLMIGGWLGLAPLGLYGTAATAAGAIAQVPNAISVVAVPNIHERYGQVGDARALKNDIKRYAGSMADLMPFFIAAAWFGATPAVRWLLPEFAACVDPMRIMVLGSFFLALGQPYQTLVIAIRKHWRLLPILTAVCVMAFILNWWVIGNGWGLTGVAWVTLTAFFFKFSLNYFLAGSTIYARGDSLKSYFGIMVKFVWMVAVIQAAEVLFGGMLNAVLKAALQYGLFCLIYFPALFRLNAEFKVLELLREMMGFAGRVKLSDKG